MITEVPFFPYMCFCLKKKKNHNRTIKALNLQSRENIHQICMLKARSIVLFETKM